MALSLREAWRNHLVIGRVVIFGSVHLYCFLSDVSSMTGIIIQILVLMRPARSCDKLLNVYIKYNW